MYFLKNFISAFFKRYICIYVYIYIYYIYAKATGNILIETNIFITPTLNM